MHLAKAVLTRGLGLLSELTEQQQIGKAGGEGEVSLP